MSPKGEHKITALSLFPDNVLTQCKITFVLVSSWLLDKSVISVGNESITHIHKLSFDNKILLALVAFRTLQRLFII